MKVLLIVLLGALGLAGALYVLGLLLPRRWRVQRTIRVAAAPDRIYPLVANLRDGWRRWNAFGTDDPTLQMVYSGPTEGVGATQAWTGRKTPAGEMHIVEADPGRGVRYALRAGPFELTGSLSFQADGAETAITWTDEGTIDNPFFRLFTPFVERAVGKPFEVGLAALRRELATEGAR
jgi:hypothetical protein